MISKVSVIIPTHNRFDSLFRAIDSVIIQTYKNIEIIVVDDNYCDLKLRKRIKIMIKKKYKNTINFIEPLNHLGGALARNLGVDKSSGEYLSFLDDDDEYYPKRIEKLMEIFNKEKDDRLALVYSYGDIIYPNFKKELESTNYVGNPLSIQMYFNIAGTSFWLVRRDVFLEVCGFEKIYSHQDGVVMLKILSKGYTIDLYKEPLVKYYFHSKSDGITSVNEKILDADRKYFEMCSRCFHLISNKQKKKVICKYYDNRNWNLIILRKKNDAIEDLKYMFINYTFSKYTYVCLYRIIFSNKVITKEKEFDKRILLGGNNE